VDLQNRQSVQREVKNLKKLGFGVEISPFVARRALTVDDIITILYSYNSNETFEYSDP